MVLRTTQRSVEHLSLSQGPPYLVLFLLALLAEFDVEEDEDAADNVIESFSNAN